MSAEADALRTVVVTGASTGIGEACALRLDSMGFKVFASVRRPSDGDALRQKASDRLTPLLLDVTDAASIRAAADAVTRETARAGLSGLVNNAGIVRAGPLELLPLSQIREQLEVNVVGPIAVTQAFLPLLRTAHGRVINMGSMSGRLASPLLGAYSASKFALEAISDALRIELSPWHIAVSIVEPGRIATPVWRKSRAVAEETLALAGPGGLELYGSTIAAGQAAAEAMSAGARSSETVARVVAHALTTRRPRARYAVGWDARVEILLARFAPDRLRDWLIASQLARYGRRRIAGKG